MPPPDPTAATPAAAPGQPGKFLRLPGRATLLRLRSQGIASLYLADTYLLQIQVVRLRESYLKFAYKDIQAIEICRTSRGTVYNVILGVVCALCLLAVHASYDSTDRYVTLGFTGFFLVLVLVNVLRGPTCRTIVQTATGKHRLYTLVRVKPARRTLALIAERIAAAQGTLDQATAARRMEDFLVGKSSRPSQPGVAAPPVAAPVSQTPSLS